MPLALLLLALLVPAHSLANPFLGVLAGTGTASQMTVYRDSGEAVDGGVHRRNLACLDCLIRLHITTGTIDAVQNGSAFKLGPGLWEVREFQGYFGYTPRALSHIEFVIDGKGHIVDMD